MDTPPPLPPRSNAYEVRVEPLQPALPPNDVNAVSSTVVLHGTDISTLVT